ncbi:fungal-specific transcription factor domain-containing protein [Mycena vitilis]|nr:fungal-specific transcription factor domain-containing protein [Mycena vitilis]
MSDSEHQGEASIVSPDSEGLPRPRKRRTQRSCDVCRHRKLRCDGYNKPDGRCSNCLAFGSPCTYEQPARKRGPKTTVEELKREIAALKAKLRSQSLCSLCAQPLQSGLHNDDPASLFHESTLESDPVDPNEPPEEQDFTGDDLASRFSRFSLESMKQKYFGAASSFALAGRAIQMKDKYLGRPESQVSPGFWDILPWEQEVYDERPQYVYPASDLIATLLDLYFATVHPTMPILHRPSFERSVAEGLHLANSEFGGLLLSVLAVASRYSNDPRVLVEGDTSQALSAGWAFARQIRTLRKLFEPTIYEVQMYFFLTLYGLATSHPQICWLYTGLGIRFLQQRGAHRRKAESHKWSTEDELWNRAFWAFVMMERSVCVFLGRPVGMHIEDYDVQPPLEVDDEYWDEGLTQPQGKPSQLSFFVHHLRLCEILSHAMRQLYSSKKAKLLLGWDGPDWEPRIVAQLDSTMNDFLDSVPVHLRWDPENPPEGTFFDQAAILHITYHYTLITIHRPYIDKPNALATPSLSISTSSARVIIQTADIWLTKLQRSPLPSIINTVFISGVILVIKMLGTKRAGGSIDQSKDLVFVAKAMEILRFAGYRSQTVGRLWELLREIWSLDCPVAKHLPNSNGASDVPASPPRGIPFPCPSYVPIPPFEPIAEQWSVPLFSEQSGPRPGMSVEQMLADTGTLDMDNMNMDVILDDELLSMWMAAPIDISNGGHWGAFLDDPSSGMDWPGGFEPLQQ